MPEIEIRPAIAADIPVLVALDHHYTSENVWQMEFNPAREEGQVNVLFRQVRLPHSVKVEYPYSPHALAENWTRRSGILVASLAGRPVGYVGLGLNMAPQTTWATDLVVDRPVRRQGIASALMLAAQEWAAQMGTNHLVLEMQPKNHAAIQLAYKIGCEFCGYNEFYYANHEIGIFFGKSLR
jgi:ribosomal protein S18 acetylase RimI-like enzyme